MGKRNILTFSQVYDLYMGGVLGTKEFRNWLVRKDDDFAAVRDSDVDNQIDDVARRQRQLLMGEPEQQDGALDSQQ